MNRIEKIEFLKFFFSENNMEKILNIFDRINLYKIEIEKIIKNCEEKNIKIFYYFYENYFKNLIGIKESFYVIFVKGNLFLNEELEKFFVIVGIRKLSKEGIDFVRDIG